MISGVRPLVSGRRGEHMNTITRGGLCVSLAALFFGLVFAAPALAQERLHQITWAHPQPETVNHFIVLVSGTEGQSEGAREVNVGLPEGTPAGHFTLFSAMIAFEPDEFLAVSAVGHDGLRSAPSGWGSMPPTRPGQPLLAE